jgi:hypothetical protein
MPDFEVSVNCTQSLVNGQERTTTKSVILENYQRNLAIPKGIDEIMKWAGEEATADTIPIPRAAIEYWQTARASGNLLMYEIQSNLENWGVTFGIKEVEDAPPVRPQPTQRNSTSRNGAATKPAHPDFRAMLQEQLEFLQSRQKELTVERKRIQSEYDDNQGQINQMTSYLMLAQPKKGRRKADVVAGDSAA